MLNSIWMFNTFANVAFVAGSIIVGTFKRSRLKEGSEVHGGSQQWQKSKLECESTLWNREYPRDQRNHSSCRRLKLEYTCCTSKRRRPSKGQTPKRSRLQRQQPVTIRRAGKQDEEEEVEVPPHLVELAQNAERGWSKEERKTIRKPVSYTHLTLPTKRIV